MKKIIIIVLTVVILAFLNYGVFEKEQIRRNGEVVLLELRPADPRSIMQGDYMRLRYKVEIGDHTKEYKDLPINGSIVVEPDENKVAQFIRFHKGEQLKDTEKLIPFHRRYRTLKILPDTFLFQEGHAKLYEQATYGIFKFMGHSQKLLIGLADNELNEIKPPPAAD